MKEKAKGGEKSAEAVESKTEMPDVEKVKEKPARKPRQQKPEVANGEIAKEKPGPRKPVFKRPSSKRAAAPKAKAVTEDSEQVRTTRKQKTDAGEKAKSSKDKTKPVEKQDDEKDKKESKTWAGRWIPAADPQRKRFMAIKAVYEEFSAKKIRRQSFFATVFFKTCSMAFLDRDLTDESTYEDFVGVAEECAGSFLTSEAVRNSTPIVPRPFLCYGFSLKGLASGCTTHLLNWLCAFAC